jgi:uncharacterized membrane protein
VRHEAWVGPLPPPQFLQQFDDVVDNGAERIMRQWEKESDHRREMERQEMRVFTRADLLGRLFSFAFVLAALAVTIVAILFDQPWVAAILGGTTIASIVWAFMKTHRDPSRD